MTGAELLVKLLEDRGVDVVFGYPGGAILPFYDALYKSDKIRHILCRHEQGAVHAATGYARVTGRVGVCIATSGPGATNLITGLTDAKSDSVPVLAITGQVAVPAIGTDAFQEADVYGITVPITKYNVLVRDAGEITEKFNEAWHVMTYRRPGPALVDFPKDVQNAEVPPEKGLQFSEETLPPRFYEKPQVRGPLEHLARALDRAKRPVFYVGGGAVNSRAEKELLALAEKVKVPVTTTLMGLSSFPGTHELSLGMLGMHGTAYANKACLETDFILSLGARFDDRVAGQAHKFCPTAIRAHVDIDPSEINKRVDVDFGITGDLAEVLARLTDLVTAYDQLPEETHSPRTDWLRKLDQYKADFPLNPDFGGVNSPLVLRRLYEKTNGQAIVSTDVGQHQMYTAQYYQFDHPQSWLTSGGLGTMGYGFPAAMGAKFAFPDREVVCVTGDGSFQMNLQELATCQAYGVAVKILLFNNSTLGMVRQWQNMFFDERYSESNLDFNPDFCHLAEAYGVPARRVEKREEIDAGIDFLLEGKGTTLLEVMIPKNEKVFPMIPAGGSFEDMIIGLDKDGQLIK